MASPVADGKFLFSRYFTERAIKRRINKQWVVANPGGRVARGECVLQQHPAAS
jgi:hypothetical protein